MPKIIENLRERLLNETRRQLEEGGYEAVTVRSIAKGCGVGLGTVYNYFPSKEAMIAAHLLEDWTACVEDIRSTAEHNDTVSAVLACMYDRLTGFVGRHGSVFRSEAAAPGFARAMGQYHAMLRAQFAQPLRKFSESYFAAEFAAEALLTWAMAGKSFEEIFEILKKQF